MSRILYHGPGPLVTMAGPNRPRVGDEMRQLSILHGWAVVADQGRIVQVGAFEELRMEPVSESIQLEGLVLPGLVDAHTHAVFAGNRLDDFERRIRGESYGEIARQGGGIQSTVRAVRESSDEQLLARAMTHAQWMRANGTAAFECKSGYGLSLEHELRILRTAQKLRWVGDSDALGEERAPASMTGGCVTATYLGAHAIPPEFAGQREKYLETVLESIPRVKEESLASACDIFVESGYFTPSDARKLAAQAKNYGLKMRLHVDQMGDGGGAELAAELGAWTADHLEHTHASAFESLERAQVIPVLLPASVVGMGHKKFPDARGMIEANLPVVLATDFNPGTSPCPSLPWVMNIACSQMRMLPSEAIAATTINAAFAAGCENDFGSIEPGKRSVFFQTDYQDPREVAYYGGRSGFGRLVL